MAENPSLLTRRVAIKRMLAMFGGTITASQLALLTESAAAMSEDSAPGFLSDEQFSMLERIVDLIIPETDTPGALGAGVHRFIDLMLAEWASPERQARYVAGLEEIDQRARASGTEGFAAVSAAQQTELLQALDRERFVEGNTETFFGELKNMVLFAYYSSETGATVELRYQAVPGDYLPCMPLDENGRAWFWMGYSYDL